MTDPAAAYDDLVEEVSRVLVGQEDLIERLTIALLTRGHVLMEGVPGVAKTTVARAFARAVGVEYQRIQMTPDVMPADITGTHVYRENTGEFELQRGPVFANVVLADEINRATPKAQSALLEAMQERQATIEGETLPLPEPFMVIATQNPIEMEGVFELPEAQRDRFMFKLRVEVPDRDEEREVLDRFDADATLDATDVDQVLSASDVAALREVVEAVHVAAPIKEYVLDLVGAVRDSDDVEVGGSPRASLALLHASKARAALHGRDYVIPDDVKALVAPAVRHRLVLSTEADLGSVGADEVVSDVVESVTPPSGEDVREETVAAEE